MDKQLSVTKDDGGGLIFLVATVIIILMVVVFVYLAGAVSAGQQSGAISPQEQSRKLGLIKPPDIGDTGIRTTVPHPNADRGMEVIPPANSPVGEPR
jgi:hypothetical protein